MTANQSYRSLKSSSTDSISLKGSMGASDSSDQLSHNLSTSKSSSKSYLESTYEKIRTVGKGAFGTAVLYRRLTDSKMVVLKEINMSELSANERQMALNEVEVLSVLHHPNIISYLGSFEADGMLVIEMEYADGGTLSQFISRAKSPIGELDILTLFKQTVSAIQYMHEHSILHRDLKTANIFLTKDDHVKIGDFGISKVMNTKSQAHTVLGTPYYISPEMCEGKQYDQKSDMWALGCILYELACREKTFQGSNLPALVNKIMKGSYEPLPTIYSSSLKLLVSDLLQKDPALRPPASVVASRVSQLYEKTKTKLASSKNFNAFKNGSKERSVLYTLSGYGPTFSLVPVTLPPKSKIVDVAISSSHYIALTADLLVYTWGEGKRGQLVLDSTPEWVNEPTLAESLMSKSIRQVGAGNGFSVFLGDSGMVLTSGDGSTGCLGHGDFGNLESPKLVESLLNVDVVQISCSEIHVVALTRDGKVHTWGTLPSHEPMSINTPQEIQIENNWTISAVSAGPEATGLITDCGKLLVQGNNVFNKLGLNQTFLGYTKVVAEALVPTRVNSLSKWFVTAVSFGRSHTALLTRDGYVVTMGSNAESQLGHNRRYPSVVSSVADRVITMAVCGPTYTAVKSQENAVYFWGTRFTQGSEITGNDSRVSMTTLETQVVSSAQEILMLYASESQISKGRIITLNSLHPLWHCMFVLVDTTAPLANLEWPDSGNVDQTSPEKNGEYDSLGPVPDWIKMELAQATEEWQGEYLPSEPSSSRSRSK